MRDRIRWLWFYWRQHKAMILILCLLTTLSAVVSVSFPLVFKAAVDAAKQLGIDAAGEEREQVLDLALILLLVGAGRSFVHLYPALRARMNLIMEVKMREAYFDRVLTKGHRFFMKFRTGDIVTRLTEDISGYPKIAWFSCSGIFRALESGTNLIFCVASMIILVDWRLALIAIAPLPFMLLIFHRIQVRLGSRYQQNQRMISRTNDYLESCYSGVRILKAYRGEDRQRQRLRDLLAERVEVEMEVVKMWAWLDWLWYGSADLGRILTIAFGGYWVLDGQLSPGSLYAIYLYVDQLVRPMNDIPNLFVSGKQAFVCMDRLDEMSDFEAGAASSRGGEQSVGEIQNVAFDDVTFRYDGAQTSAVTGATLEIPAGRRLAVVGPVGSGKSTLARLLSGELEPTSGRVLINRRDLEELDLIEYRNRTGYIPQEALLFSDTIRENVSFGRGLPDADVRASLGVAQMEKEIERFPKGIEEMLGQRGVRVSGGQRQRLAIARALGANPELIIMDDVTAALDAENEEALWDAMESRRKNLTGLVVTHRLSTARRADSIVVMDEGRIVDRGSHRDLIARCALYRRLAHEEL